MVINCSGCYTICSFHCPRSYFLFPRSSIACLARPSAIPSIINRDSHNYGTGSQARVTAHPRLVRFISHYLFMFYSTVRRHMCPELRCLSSLLRHCTAARLFLRDLPPPENAGSASPCDDVQFLRTDRPPINWCYSPNEWGWTDCLAADLLHHVGRRRRGRSVIPLIYKPSSASLSKLHYSSSILAHYSDGK